MPLMVVYAMMMSMIIQRNTMIFAKARLTPANAVQRAEGFVL
jgi:hypothetical protein